MAGIISEHTIDSVHPNISPEDYGIKANPTNKTDAPARHMSPHQVKKTIITIGGVALFVGLIGGTLLVLKSPINLRSFASTSKPALSMQPAAQAVSTGSEFPIGILLNANGNKVSAVELHITYDANAIQVVSFSPGTRLPVILTPESHGNGKFSVTLGARPAIPLTGSNVIGTLNVKVIGNLSSSIIFDPSTAVASFEQSTTSLAGTSGAVITVVTK